MMMIGGPRRPLRGLIVLVTLACGLAGCDSDPTAVSAVPAAGTVTYKSKPLAKGTIQFVPEVGRPASGEIVDGKFTLSTYGTDDGAIPGKHKVAVTSATEEKTKDGDTRLKHLIPEAYSGPDSSGLVIEIPKRGITKIEIELK
jgi:hypothetical protein